MKSLSEDHKEALARGRKEARTVRAYLDALAVKKPRGVPSAATLEQRLERLTEQIETEENSLKRLQYIQQRFDVEDKLKALEGTVDFETLEADFIEAAASYSERKDISYHAWREANVPADVLKRAGVKRTRRT